MKFVSLKLLSLALALIVYGTSAHPTPNGQEDAVCNTPGCVAEAEKLIRDMDQSVDPCDDFYEFTCGNFIRNAKIPEGKSEVSPIVDMGEVVQMQLKTVLEEPSDNDLRPFKLAKKFYKLCMDEKKFEDFTYVKELLKNLGGWPILEGDSWDENNFDWTKSVVNFKKYGVKVNHFLKIGISIEQEDSTRLALSLDQPDFEPERINVIRGTKFLRGAGFHDYLTDVAGLLGADKELAKNEIDQMFEFEVELAKIALSKQAHEERQLVSNYLTVKEVQEKYPFINWLEFINKVTGLSDVSINETQRVDLATPDYFSKLADVLKKTPKRVQANYAIFQYLPSIILYLPKAVRDRHQQFMKLAFTTSEDLPRWHSCVTQTSKAFDNAVGGLYVRRYFNQETKKAAAEMVTGIRDAFLKVLEETEWMDEETKKKAVDKAMAIKFNVGCSDNYFKDDKMEELHKTITFDSENILDYAANLSISLEDEAYHALHKPLNKSEVDELLSPMTVNAQYSPQTNSIDLSAGILQKVVFNKDRLRSMNYGGMGYFIGHEITHGFDHQGRKFDKHGNLVTWWPETVSDAFEKKAQCIIDQYSNYTVPEVGININGKLSEGENIADNGGMREAYLAYKIWLEKNGPEPKLPGLKYTARQLFWIAAASCWCAKETKEALEAELEVEEHPPGQFRVIGTFSNLEDFAKDFQCPEGSKMNPKNKCKVW